MSAGRAFEPKVSKGHAVVAAHASQGADRVAVAELSGDGSATHDSLLGYILEAAERLAFAWTVLCKDASRHGDALAARRDSARRVIDRLQNLVSLARDTLAPSTLSPQTISAAENSTDSSSRPRTDAATDERAPSASAGSLDRGDTTPDAPSLVARPPQSYALSACIRSPRRSSRTTSAAPRARADWSTTASAIGARS